MIVQKNKTKMPNEKTKNMVQYDIMFDDGQLKIVIS